MAGRRCPGRDEVGGRVVACPTILTGGQRRCPRHAAQYEARRGTRQARGYDATHDRLRANWQRRIDEGERVVCATCPTVIVGRLWQLGHDHVRGGYLGPQCVPCNTGDGGSRGARSTNARRDASP
jgi:hypothetical protein